MRHPFILPNDTFKSEHETIHFHRGMIYSVSHVFNDNGKFRIFIKDKNGLDIEFKEYNFIPTTKTMSASDERQKRARLDFYWNNPDSPFVLNVGYHFKAETSELFSLNNRAYFAGKGDEGIIAKISRHKEIKTETGYRRPVVEGSEASFKTKEQFYDYFKKIDLENFRINGLFNDPQTAIDHLQFMLNIPQYDESKLCIPSVVDQTPINWFIQRNRLNLLAFLNIVADVIFDEEDLSNENKQIVMNVMEAYELLPNSHGPTSVSKLIMGKEKKTISSVKHLSGTCTTLKQPQAFTLCDIIETFMYTNGIFVKTDEYSNGTEWRGAYEFIGSKMINTDEFDRIKNYLNELV